MMYERSAGGWGGGKESGISRPRYLEETNREVYLASFVVFEHATCLGGLKLT